MDAYKSMDRPYEEDVEDPFLPGNNQVSFESKDPIAAIIFLANFGVVAYMALFWGAPNISHFNFTNHTTTEKPHSQAMSFFITALSMGIVGALLSALWLRVLQLYASKIIHMTIQGSAISLCVASFVGFSEAGIAGRAIGFANLILVAMVVLYYFSVRQHIPFAASNLAVASKILQRFPQVVFVAYGAIAAQVAWMALWSVALVGVWVKTYDDHVAKEEIPSTSYLNVCVFFMLLSLFWGLQVLRNVVHCTAAGTIGEWWFSPDVHNAVDRAFKRAISTSFGSICLGSLIVAALSSLRFVLLSAKRRKSRNTVNTCLECLVSLLENHMNTFNKYAYCQVALYGKDFRSAGRDTLQLFREKGWSGVVNESLVTSVLSMGCLVVGATTGVIGVGYLYITMACSEEELKSKGSAQCETFNVMIMTFVSCGAMGYAMCAVVSSILDSIVATVFVCFAEDPVALHITNSEEYVSIVDAWRQYHPELLTHSTFSHSVSYA